MEIYEDAHNGHGQWLFFFKQCSELKPNLEANPLVHHSLSAASNERIPICYWGTGLLKVNLHWLIWV